MTTGEVAGVVYDEAANPLRGVLITCGTRETQSNSAGGYVLEGIPRGEQQVVATFSKDGVSYSGINVAEVFGGERSNSVNLVAIPNRDQAVLTGLVTNGVGGSPLKGAKVFARQSGGEVLSATFTQTDDFGRYRLEGLRGGMAYEVLANGLGYDSDRKTITPVKGETTTLVFAINRGGTTHLSAPTNLAATAFTAPKEITRGGKLAIAMEAAKQYLDPKRKTRHKSRLTSGGNEIEVDLTWDKINSDDLLGYGIYRAKGSGSSFGDYQNVGYLNDPLAEIYEDMDPNLAESSKYTYAITALGNDFDGTGRGESDFSNTFWVRPLGDQTLLAPTPTVFPTFRWNETIGADEYAILVYADYPDFDETPLNDAVWQSGTSWTWNKAALTAGRTYYYIVFARSSDGDFSISPVGTVRPG